jgi:hypothetical protein
MGEALRAIGLWLLLLAALGALLAIGAAAGFGAFALLHYITG